MGPFVSSLPLHLAHNQTLPRLAARHLYFRSPWTSHCSLFVVPPRTLRDPASGTSAPNPSRASAVYSAPVPPFWGPLPSPPTVTPQATTIRLPPPPTQATRPTTGSESRTFNIKITVAAGGEAKSGPAGGGTGTSRPANSPNPDGREATGMMVTIKPGGGSSDYTPAPEQTSPVRSLAPPSPPAALPPAGAMYTAPNTTPPPAPHVLPLSPPSATLEPPPGTSHQLKRLTRLRLPALTPAAAGDTTGTTDADTPPTPPTPPTPMTIPTVSVWGSRLSPEPPAAAPSGGAAGGSAPTASAAPMSTPSPNLAAPLPVPLAATSGGPAGPATSTELAPPPTPRLASSPHPSGRAASFAVPPLSPGGASSASPSLTLSTTLPQPQNQPVAPPPPPYPSMAQPPPPAPMSSPPRGSTRPSAHRLAAAITSEPPPLFLEFHLPAAFAFGSGPPPYSALSTSSASSSSSAEPSTLSVPRDLFGGAAVAASPRTGDPHASLGSLAASAPVSIRPAPSAMTTSRRSADSACLTTVSPPLSAISVSPPTMMSAAAASTALSSLHSSRSDGKAGPPPTQSPPPPLPPTTANGAGCHTDTSRSSSPAPAPAVPPRPPPTPSERQPTTANIADSVLPVRTPTEQDWLALGHRCDTHGPLPVPPQPLPSSRSLRAVRASEGRSARPPTERSTVVSQVKAPSPPPRTVHSTGRSAPASSSSPPSDGGRPGMHTSHSWALLQTLARAGAGSALSASQRLIASLGAAVGEDSGRSGEHRHHVGAGAHDRDSGESSTPPDYVPPAAFWGDISPTDSTGELLRNYLPPVTLRNHLANNLNRLSRILESQAAAASTAAPAAGTTGGFFMSPFATQAAPPAEPVASGRSGGGGGGSTNAHGGQAGNGGVTTASPVGRACSVQPSAIRSLGDTPSPTGSHHRRGRARIVRVLGGMATEGAWRAASARVAPGVSPFDLGDEITSNSGAQTARPRLGGVSSSRGSGSGSPRRGASPPCTSRSMFVSPELRTRTGAWSSAGERAAPASERTVRFAAGGGRDAVLALAGRRPSFAVG